MHSSQFHKSSYSANEAACVEVAEGSETLVRDTQHREAGHLSFPASEWAPLLGTARRQA
ncbi:protein of unknown function [Nocardiopsis flavescens]|uniref:DUF397 domain-containing protein n=1 Tax=Nocardiopsis flavescens TaxID=758803 RepID=A0A1M6TRM0_9ACTN|nr:DUF397 domain-containing protein [Nocardiopsis flavescens]SHK59570.1 protein of unknown function [Nocardiopsis flavescens]